MGVLTSIRRASIFAALCLILAVPAAADLVVLSDGGFLEVSAWAVDGERVRLELPSGGLLVMPLLRIARIVEDIPASEPAPGSEAAFSTRFDDGHGAPEVPYGRLIYEAAERHGLNPELVAAVVRAESAFDSRAVSHKGARGLMQLMPATARRFGLDETTVFEPAHNLDAGSRYLRWLLDRFDDRLDHALAGYNAGEGTVDRYRGVPPYRETREYVRRIYSGLGIAENAGPAGPRAESR